MKNKNWNKIKNKQVFLITLSLINLCAGLCMMLEPEEVNDLIIRSIGILLILEGVSYSLDALKKYIEDKM